MAAGDVLSGMTRYPSAGWYSTGAYLISGIPFLKTTAVLGDEISETINFTAISREITVLSVAGVCQVHFGAEGAAEDGGQPTNVFTLAAGQSVTLPIRTKQVVIRGEGGGSQASVAATLTGITDIADYPTWNGAGGTA